MTTNKLISKSVLIVVVLLVAGISAANIRTLLWDDPWCNTFSPDGSCCLKCSFRCYKDKYDRCQPVSDYCKTWDECTGKCTSCYQGYAEPVNGVCSNIPVGSTPNVTDDHCAKYGYVDGSWKLINKYYDGCKKVCVECDCDYYLTCNYTCVLLPQNCKAADQYGNCEECKDGYHLDCGKCVKDIVSVPVDHCIQYGYIDSANKWYTQYSAGCKKVCKACEYGFYLTCNYTCVALPANCEAADIYGNCINCCKGYDLKNGKCIVQDDHCDKYGYVDSAKKWYNSFVKGCKKVCKSCDKGYYLNCDYQCVALPANCEAADQNGKCTKCCDGYDLVEGKCVVDDHCSEYGYVDSAKKWYKSYVSGCKKVCKCCDKGFYLTSDYTCVKIPAYCENVTPQGECTKCCDGYHLYDNVCYVNDPNCDVYAWTDASGKWYNEWACGRDQVCKCCDKGYYLNCNGLCVKNPAYCEDVNAKGECTKCCDGYHLYNNVCIVNDPYCDVYAWTDASGKWYSEWASGRNQVCKCCDKGYYLNCDGTCKKIPAYCEAVNEKGECTKCCDGYHLYNNVCIVNDPNCENYGWTDASGKWYSQWACGRDQVCKCCDKGYYLNCDNICKKIPAYCEDVNAKGECTQCCDGYHLYNNVCIVNDPNCDAYGWTDATGKWYSEWASGRNQVCKCCENGYYFDCDNICRKLPSHCEKAKADGTCICCDEGYELCDGKCIKKVVKVVVPQKCDDESSSSSNGKIKSNQGKGHAYGIGNGVANGKGHK